MLQIAEIPMSLIVIKLSHNIHPSVMQKAYQILTYAIWKNHMGKTDR
jgi:hypothetical protein